MQINANSMMAHQDWMNTNAHNVANVNTQDFQATATTLQNPVEGSVQAVSSTTDFKTDLANEFTDQIVIEHGFDANAQVIKTKDEMLGSLIDLTI